jgi:hypothetical protein
VGHHQAQQVRPAHQLHRVVAQQVGAAQSGHCYGAALVTGLQQLFTVLSVGQGWSQFCTVAKYQTLKYYMSQYLRNYSENTWRKKNFNFNFKQKTSWTNYACL